MQITHLLATALAALPLASAIPLSGAAHGPTPSLPRRTIAGVSVVDTPLIRAAQQYMRDHSNDAVYNHVMRTWLFGTLMVANNATLRALVDPEVQAVSLLLHDLGFDRTPGSKLVSEDKRFEVDGAIAARDFIRDHREGRGWEERRVQLVWDAIALHTEQKYALFKEPDVETVSRGIFMDFSGPDRGVTKEEYQKVADVFPQDTLRDSVKDVFIWLCRSKPVTTYDTFMQPFGERFVANYSAVGSRTVDFVLGPQA
ncbi:hypothetical protein B0H67DRAFT_603524 [Lasiosphaeris hirsuta]|uniref:HD domain-containing protein n=1 Tax=Lasiosphaeris hirsuta TaxID=260670 RepID=A0AA40DQU0_9PEZI|nr:hypothetical protein B0H67DRAFT_603524 [Lasiosphaeris hirsuta]